MPEEKCKFCFYFSGRLFPPLPTVRSDCPRVEQTHPIESKRLKFIPVVNYKNEKARCNRKECKYLFLFLRQTVLTVLVVGVNDHLSLTVHTIIANF
jgi:hypothetical protein